MIAEIDPQTEVFLNQHSAELTILLLSVLVVVTLYVIVPQLLRAQLRNAELMHAEHMRGLERGLPMPVTDEASRAAGRCAMLVPMAVVITAGTVTCFMVAYKIENIFAVALAVWTVAGIVSLAAITGGVALLGRLAQLNEDEKEDELYNAHDGSH